MCAFANQPQKHNFFRAGSPRERSGVRTHCRSFFGSIVIDIEIDKLSHCTTVKMPDFIPVISCHR